MLSRIVAKSAIMVFKSGKNAQIPVSYGEWAMKGSFIAACQDFRLGIPGMLLQLFGGYALIKYLIRK